MKINLLQAQTLRGEEREAAYAVLDATGTREIFDALLPRLNADQARIYAWNRAQQSPAVCMGLRGIRVDEFARERSLRTLRAEREQIIKDIRGMPVVQEHWDGFTLEKGWCKVERLPNKKGKLPKGGTRQRHKWPKGTGKEKNGVTLRATVCALCGTGRTKYAPFEPGSTDQVAHLLYERLGMQKVYSKEGGITTDDEALQKLARKYPAQAQLCGAILELRDRVKQIGFLSAKLSPTGRFHSSFNVAAPWTGRWSSSKNPFGWGGNAQNITERHRHIFVPDLGFRMGYADLKTAESLKVAYLSGDEAYITAHEGDVHTWVCREVWPELPWTGDIKRDKKIASSNYPPWDNVEGHDYRFQSKRVQHGSNFGLTPRGMAMIAHIPVKAAEQAQERYFASFPMIREWQKHQGGLVSQGLPLYNALRRVVTLMGRPWDGHTYKQGLAFPPQSGVGDILNLGLWRLWSQCDGGSFQVLAQVHDAVLFQYLLYDDHVDRDREVAEMVTDYMTVRCPVTDFRGVERTCTIPVEVALGENWGKRSADNPKGLEEVKL